jgi:hypothetical protein
MVAVYPADPNAGQTLNSASAGCRHAGMPLAKGRPTRRQTPTAKEERDALDERCQDLAG